MHLSDQCVCKPVNCISIGKQEVLVERVRLWDPRPHGSRQASGRREGRPSGEGASVASASPCPRCTAPHTGDPEVTHYRYLTVGLHTVK